MPLSSASRRPAPPARSRPAVRVGLALLALLIVAGTAAATGLPAAGAPVARARAANLARPVARTQTTDPAGTDHTSATGRRRVADENRKIWLVVAGLVGVAIALTLLTVTYWRHTRPDPATADHASGRGAPRRGRRPDPDLDPVAAVVDQAAFAAVVVVDDPPPPATAAPTPVAPEAVVPEVGAPAPVAPEVVVPEPVAPEVAAPEPVGSGAAETPHARPSREQRAAAYAAGRGR